MTDATHTENLKDEKGEVTKCRFCDSRFHYQRDCVEYNNMVKKGTGMTQNTMIIDKTRKNEKDRNESASAHIVEEVKF